MAVLDLKNAQFYILDGTGTPNTVEIRIGEGNLTYSEKVEREYILDRGILEDIRNGDEVPMDLSFDFTYTEMKSITGDTTPTVYEALKKIGAASSWASTDADPCNPYCVDIKVVIDPPCTGSGSSQQIETILFPDFRYESIDVDMREARVSVTGKCNVTAPTITRSAQT